MKKITFGYVEQEFDDNGKLVKQEFFAGEVEYEKDGKPYSPTQEESKYYHPFYMECGHGCECHHNEEN